jgi:hypothetical protein
MSIHKNISGAWKNINEIHANVSGTWKKVLSGWVYIASVWKQFFSSDSLPENIIAFSTSTSIGDWLKMDGSEASPSLIGKYPKVAASEGSTGGSTTHSHSISTNTGGATVLRLNYDSIIGYRTENHTHSMSHTHGATNHEPSYLNVLPVVNGSDLKTSMFLFYDGATAPIGWSTNTAALNKFYKGAATPGGTGGNTTHTHSITGNTGSGGSEFLFPNMDYAGPYAVHYASSHTHSMSHTHGATSNEPLWKSLLPVSPDAETKELPSGICAFFKGSVVPDGWSYYSVAAGRWIQGKTSLTTGGLDTHTHAFSGNSSAFTGTSRTADTSSDYYSLRYSSHTHSISHTHGSTNNIPPYQELMFLKKD